MEESQYELDQRKAAEEAHQQRLQELQDTEQKVQEELKKEQEAAAADIPMPQPKQRGPITAVGEVAKDLIDGSLMNDYVVKPISDAVLGTDLPTSDEAEQIADDYYERQDAKPEGLSKFLSNTSRNVEGFGEGFVGGGIFPITLAADLSNQDAPWSRPPARMENSFFAPILFEIGEIAGAMTVAGMAGAPVSGAAVTPRLFRAGVETATVGDVDQLIGGRTLAVKLGELAEAIGAGDAEEVTRDLIEGRSLQSKAYLKTAAFIQSYITDWGVDAVVSKFFPNTKPDKVSERVAKLRGTTPEEVQKKMGEVYGNVVGKFVEPEDTVTGNSVAPTQMTTGNSAFAPESLQYEILRQTGVAEDGLTNAQRKYFTNFDVISEDSNLQNIIEAALEDVPRLVETKSDLGRGMTRAVDFWNRNGNLLDDNFSGFLNKLVSEDLTTPLNRLTGELEIDNISNYFSAESTLNMVRRPEAFMIFTMAAEEMSVKISKMATIINNLDDLGVDSSAATKEMFQMMKKSQLILRPLRRAKRIWSLSGVFQQRMSKAEMVEALQDAAESYMDDAAEAAEFIYKENQVALEQLFQLAKDGNKDAKKTQKMLFAQLAAGDARQALETVEISSELIKKSLKEGNADAVSSLFYQVGLLSRVATQTVAVSNTIMRQTLEPFAQLAFNAPRAALEAIPGVPAAMTSTADLQMRYAAGQLYGGVAHFGEALAMMGKSFLYNKPVSGTTRYAKKAETLLAKQAKLDQTYRATRKVLQEEGASQQEIFMAWMDYTLQSIANNPVINAPTRFLTAFDSAGQSTAFNGHISGMAAMRAGPSLKGFNEIYKKIRKDSLGKTGDLFKGIKNPELLEVSKFQTFQRQITQGEDATWFDNLFKTIERGAQDSGVFRFVSPFARISWDFLDQLQLVASGTLPFDIGTSILSKTNPKFYKMLKGEMGVPMQMQAKQVQQLSMALTMYMVYTAMNGNATGKIRSGTIPEDSFLVPSNNEAGFMAVPYSRIQPYGSLMSITADVTNNYRIGAIDRGAYEEGLTEIVASVIDNTLDQTTLAGIVNFTDFLSRGAAQKGWLSDAVELSSTPLAPAFTRMIGGIAEPYRKPLVDQGSPLRTAGAAYVSKAAGGFGLPTMTDIYSNTPDATVATASSGKDYWEAVRGSIVNEFAFPGKVKDAYKDAGYNKLFAETGYRVDKRYLQKVEGIPLPLESQALLSKEIAELGLGERLTEYYNSDYYANPEYGLRAQLEKARKAQTSGGGIAVIPIPLGKEAQLIQDKILNDIKEIHDNIKTEAVENGHLFKNEEFRQRYEAEKLRQSASTPRSNYQGMYAEAANQSTELASQVRNILDIPT